MDTSELRAQLKQLHRQFGHTMIYVTHDQTEALTFADRVVVMHDGRVVQMGTPQELFETPAHTFVGYFIGSPGMNVLLGTRAPRPRRCYGDPAGAACAARCAVKSEIGSARIPAARRRHGTASRRASGSRISAGTRSCAAN
jgi:ABC-type sugar transport system ATPase subunit